MKSLGSVLVLRLFTRPSLIRKDLLWIVLGQGLAVTGGVAGIKLLTIGLGPRGYGVLALALAGAGLGNQLIYGPLGQAATRFVSIAEARGELRAFLRVIGLAHLIAAALFLISAVLAMAVWSICAGPRWLSVIGLAGLLAIVAGINLTFYGMQVGMRNHRMVTLHQGTEAWLRATLAYGIVMAFSAGAAGALAGYVVAAGLVAVSIARRTLSTALGERAAAPGGSDGATGRMRRKMQAYAVPFVGFGLFGLVSLYADRWMLSYLRGVEDVGVYAAMYQLAFLPSTVLGNIVTQALLPVAFKNAGDLSSLAGIESARRAHHLALLVLGVLLAGWIAISYLFGETLLELIASREFSAYGHVLWVLAGAAALFQLSQVMAVGGMYHLCPAIYLLAKGAHAAAVLVLGWFMTAWQGLPGLCAAMFVSSVMYLLAVISANRDVSREA